MRLGRWERTPRGRRLVYDRSRRLGELPAGPAALRVYNDNGEARALPLDFDPQLVGGNAAQVEQDAATAAALLADAGARIVADVSPRGGRHLWAPLAAPATRDELLPIARALQRLCPSLDAAPLHSVATGCMTGPGSPTKCGGHRQLLTPLAAAVEAVQRRSHPDLLARLRARLAPAVDVDSASAGPARVDERATARAGGPRPLDAIARGIAERGIWPATRRTPAGQLWTGSEARQSVLAACAARGWSLTDVRARLTTGQWPGLAGLYAKYGRHGDAQLQRDWAAALRYAATRPAPSAPPVTPVAQGHTSGEPPTHGGRSNPTSPLAQRDHARQEYRHLRRLYSIAERAADTEPWGRGEIGRTRWAVLRALIVTAMRRASRYVNVGTRSLTFSAAMLDHGTVAKVLRELRADPDGWIELIESGRGTAGDLYELRIPARYAHLHPEREPLPAGRLPDVHPVFAALGLAAWRVLEIIESGVRDVAGIIAASHVSRGHVYKIIKVLTDARLVAAASTGAVRRTRRTLSAAARALGVPDRLAERRARYRAERDAWRNVLAERGRRDWAELTWMMSADGPLWWPDIGQLEPPPDHPDPPTEAEAIGLLSNALGAVIIAA